VNSLAIEVVVQYKRAVEAVSTARTAMVVPLRRTAYHGFSRSPIGDKGE
jgi:hypothetical protein